MRNDAGSPWYVSPITLRILAVNIGALLLLGAGLLYSGQYERELIRTELSALSAEGKLLASALAEGATRPDADGNPQLAEDLARHLLRKLGTAERQRLILFSKTGALLLDTHQMLGPSGVVEVVELPPPLSSLSLGRRLQHYGYRALDLLPTRLHLPRFPKTDKPQAQSYPKLLDTLGGHEFSDAWRDDDGKVLLTASLPVQQLKNVLGGILLARDGRDIDGAVRALQMTVIRLFLWALLVTILLSIYLSETIARPIARLAAAADNVRQSPLLKDTVPDLSWRGDEVGRLSTALIEMTRSLSDRIESAGNFAADVAHEIKNPLTSARSATETLARVSEPAQRQKLLDILIEDIDRINRLVTDISAVSRLDTELMNSEKTRIDMAKLLLRMTEGQNIACMTGRDTELIVTGNVSQLEQVLQNLLDNALSFAAGNGKVRVSAQRTFDKIVVHVDNDGPRIPENRLEAIFQRFYSERPETEKFGRHSGLGLSISRQIVRAHRGTLFAENLEEGTGGINGVRFTMTLPVGR